MAQMDEFRKEREAIKTAPLKKRLSYFWDYYKWHTLFTIVVIAIICGYVHHVATAKTSILNGVLLNSFADNETAVSLREYFAAEREIDLSKYDIVLNTSFSYGDSFTYTESRQAIIAQTAAGMIDFFTGDTESMQDMAYSFMLADLRQVLTEEQQQQYEPYFIYIDQDVLDAIDAASDNIDEPVAIEYPDWHNPNSMENPIPVLIDISRCNSLRTMYDDSITELAFGVSASATNMDQTLAFLDYLMTEIK